MKCKCEECKSLFTVDVENMYDCPQCGSGCTVDVTNSKQEVKYKTKPIDYTGCDPIIAEHLKRGESVLCECYDVGFPEKYVSSYHYSNRLKKPMYGTVSSDSYYTYARPLVFKQYVKKASEIVKWLEDNGYELNSCNEFIHYHSHDGYSLDILQLCGKEYKYEKVIRHEWLEER